MFAKFDYESVGQRFEGRPSARAAFCNGVLQYCRNGRANLVILGAASD
jgi:hypothetical protein